MKVKTQIINFDKSNPVVSSEHVPGTIYVYMIRPMEGRLGLLLELAKIIRAQRASKTDDFDNSVVVMLASEYTKADIINAIREKDKDDEGRRIVLINVRTQNISIEDIERYINEFNTEGHKVNGLIIDNINRVVGNSVNFEDERQKIRELSVLANKYNIPICTAKQKPRDEQSSMLKTFLSIFKSLDI